MGGVRMEVRRLNRRKETGLKVCLELQVGEERLRFPSPSPSSFAGLRLTRRTDECIRCFCVVLGRRREVQRSAWKTSVAYGREERFQASRGVARGERSAH